MVMQKSCIKKGEERGKGRNMKIRKEKGEKGRKPGKRDEERRIGKGTGDVLKG